MESDVILTKMDSMRRCVKRLEEKRPDNWDTIQGDYDLQDILSVNLERTAQLFCRYWATRIYSTHY